LLCHLHLSVEPKDRERNKKYEVWEDSFDWKECRANKLMQQKLEYMHDNPCKGKWDLAPSPIDYQHSSAKFYATGEQSLYTVKNFAELNDIDLTKPLNSAESTARAQSSERDSAEKQKKRLKTATFKVISNGVRLGERFLKIIFDNALANKVDEIYVTIFDKRDDQKRLIDLLNNWGFKYWGNKK
jgi:hypothetical protein